MSLPDITPDATRLVTATGPGLVDGTRLAVPAGPGTGETAALLWPRGAAVGRPVPVRLVPAAGLPENVVVVPEPLAAELRLADSPWLIRFVDATAPAAVELESPAELSLDEAARHAQNSPLLSGHVFSYDDQHEDVWIDLDGHPFRVRSVTDASGRPVRGLLRIGRDTSVSVFAPGVRSAVDIVVLADCSGSMGLDDIPDTREGLRFSRGGRVSRMDALKRALHTMIDARAQVDGLITRFALVRFDTSTRMLFPNVEGMAEVTTAVGDDSLQRLRAAVTLLRPTDQPTDIGRALHRAAELLYRHGVPENDKLIVLVSDGAHWTPMGDDRSGESVAGIDDPVATMEELHNELGFRLHAVGISDETLFSRWWDEYCRRQGRRTSPEEYLVPNHQLLGELVGVAGGDRHRIGGVEVLEEYFRELGSGVVRSVGRPAPARLPALQIDVAKVTAEARSTGVTASRLKEWTDLTQTVLERYSQVCSASVPRLGYPLFVSAQPSDLLRLERIATTYMEGTAWLTVANKIFHERLHESVRHPKGDPQYLSRLPFPELTVPLWDGRLGEINGLRNHFSHNPDAEKRQQDSSKRKQDSGKRLEEAQKRIEDAQKRKEEKNRQVGMVLLKHTGKYDIGDEDAEGWYLLQRGLLTGLAGMLSDVHTLLVSPPPGFRPPEPALQNGGTGPSGSPAPAAGSVVVKSQGF